MLKLLMMSAAAAAVLLGANAAGAFDMSPVVIEFDPSGSGAQKSFQIKNTQAETIAVQLSAFKRTQNPDGSDQLVPEDADFVIVPSQMVIAKGQTQIVCVQWLGDGKPDHELAYRLVAEQVPVPYATPEQGAKLQVAVSYHAAAYVRPAGSTPNVEVAAAAPVRDGDNQALAITLRSRGATRGVLADPTLTVTAGGKSVTLSGGEIARLKGVNVLSGSQRTVLLPWPKGVPVGPVQASLTTSYMTR